MKIDLPAINSAVIHSSSERDDSDGALRVGLEHQLSEVGGLLRNEAVNATSSIVTISEGARNAALAFSDPASSDPVLSATEVDPSAVPQNDAGVNLDQLMFDMLSGRKILGVSAADLQSVRSGAANSDLQLKAIENAAQRAGFGTERKIHQAPSTVDETTFQARGVIRTEEPE